MISWLAFVESSFSGWWTLVPLSLFIALVAGNSRSRKRIERLAALRRFSAEGLARLTRSWNDIAEVEITPPESHLYHDDLDLFGKASIFSLLSVCRTRAGVETLASWLLASSDRDSIVKRQHAADELRERVDLRRDLFIGAEGEISQLGLRSFDQSDVELKQPPLVFSIVALALGVANLVFLVGWLGSDLPRLWFFVSVLISMIFAFAMARSKAALVGMDGLSGELRAMITILERIDRESFESDTLRDLQETLTRGSTAALDGIEKLNRLVSMHDYQRNQMFYPVALLLLWETQIALSTVRWRNRFGSRINEWMAALGELEAIVSLANFSWENPEYVQPEIVESTNVEVYAEDAGHPMIEPADLVRNGITIDSGRRLYLVSGSNMSGKSTMLRTVGTNCVLALAGAVVSARSLRLSRVTVAASIQVRDSLEDGRSRFYAEILRLRQIVEKADTAERVLFLLDEVLHGTNSHDRRLGAHAVLRSLIDKGASGMVTTHDLALAEISSDLPGAVNVHFEDRVEEDQMIFDYRMQPGVVTRSNAIELMRRIGLDV